MQFVYCELSIGRWVIRKEGPDSGKSLSLLPTLQWAKAAFEFFTSAAEVADANRAFILMQLRPVAGKLLFDETP